MHGRLHVFRSEARPRAVQFRAVACTQNAAPSRHAARRHADPARDMCAGASVGAACGRKGTAPVRGSAGAVPSGSVRAWTARQTRLDARASPPRQRLPRPNRRRHRPSSRGCAALVVVTGLRPPRYAGCVPPPTAAHPLASRVGLRETVATVAPVSCLRPATVTPIAAVPSSSSALAGRQRIGHGMGKTVALRTPFAHAVPTCVTALAFLAALVMSRVRSLCRRGSAPTGTGTLGRACLGRPKARLAPCRAGQALFRPLGFRRPPRSKTVWTTVTRH